MGIDAVNGGGAGTAAQASSSPGTAARRTVGETASRVQAAVSDGFTRLGTSAQGLASHHVGAGAEPANFIERGARYLSNLAPRAAGARVALAAAIPAVLSAIGLGALLKKSQDKQYDTIAAEVAKRTGGGNSGGSDEKKIIINA